MAVPIIGQPKVTDYFVALQLRCPCGATFMLVGVTGAMRPCAGCGAVYRLEGLPSVAPDGSLSVNISRGVAQRHDPTAAPPPADKNISRG